ncbi:carbamoyltransferase family protein [Aquimarina rhabdastrellae]
MYVLGISAFYHDAAACLLKNGRIVAAAQEERFTRIKHDPSFPIQSITFCIAEEKIAIADIDLIVFYEKPFLKFERIITTFQHQTPYTFNTFRKTISSWIKQKLWIPNYIKKELDYNGKIIFSEHHESHAAGTFFTSPFKKSAILTIDGVGEHACTTIGIGEGNTLKIIKEQHYPHSIGLLYSAFTLYCGFKVNSGEYKLMGLAPYGTPLYKDTILKHIVSYTEEGAIQLNLEHFAFEKGQYMINTSFCNVLGKKARVPESKMEQFYCDVASSIQSIIEDIIIKLAVYTKKITGLDQLCLSGGVALNCKANGELLKQNIFKEIWVQPASGDAGGAVGAAYVGWYQYLKKERIYLKDSLKDQIYLGVSYTDKEIKEVFSKYDIDYIKADEETLTTTVTRALKEKKIIGWFQGKMEFGPRALGHRSILASPLYEDMKKHVNLSIKKREGFRPFAPIVLEEKVGDWFIGDKISKYMLFTFESEQKMTIPSCIHEDRTARVQTLNKEDNSRLHNVITKFEEQTACPVLINTSFNVRGEPIVASPADALRCFYQTGMDILVIEDFIIQKEKGSIPHENLIQNSNYELD